MEFNSTINNTNSKLNSSILKFVKSPFKKLNSAFTDAKQKQDKNKKARKTDDVILIYFVPAIKQLR